MPFFVPANEVPHYLRGVKVQVFHGLAGEKTGHFRIRNYFDLYLTQGPYFTKEFLKFEKKYKNFEVKETGWCKLDSLYQHHEQYRQERKYLVAKAWKETPRIICTYFFAFTNFHHQSKKKLFLTLADRQDIFLLIKFS
jgi:hypothetical protein